MVFDFRGHRLIWISLELEHPGQHMPQNNCLPSAVVLLPPSFFVHGVCGPDSFLQISFPAVLQSPASSVALWCHCKTSDVTGCHRGPKCKCMFVCRYVAPPGECYYNTLLCGDVLSSSVALCAFSVLCVYSKIGHHPHPLGYLCAKFHFCCNRC